MSAHFLFYFYAPSTAMQSGYTCNCYAQMTKEQLQCRAQHERVTFYFCANHNFDKYVWK